MALEHVFPATGCCVSLACSLCWSDPLEVACDVDFATHYIYPNITLLLLNEAAGPAIWS